jgi:transposase
MAIKPNPEHATPEELEIAKESTPEKHHYIRLYAIQQLMQGKKRREVAKNFNRDINTITQWVKRWNEGGIDALRSVKKPGRPKKLTEEHVRSIQELLLHPELAGESHWTLVKLHGHLKNLWSEGFSYNTLRNYVERLGFAQVVPRPWAENQDPEQRARFVEELRGVMENPENEVWFADETGVIGDPRPRRRWTIIGSRPRVPFTGAHIRQSVIGAVHPATGEIESLIVPEVDAEIFQLFLDQFAKATRGHGKRIVLVLDNASWHKSKRLNWHHITPMYLPTYSPDLNPIERLWAQVKSNFFADWFAKSHEELSLRLIKAMRFFIKHKDSVAKTCAL